MQKNIFLGTLTSDLVILVVAIQHFNLDFGDRSTRLGMKGKLKLQGEHTPYRSAAHSNDFSIGSLAEMLPSLLDELRRIAHGQMMSQSPDHTLQTTALMNEAVLKLLKGEAPEYVDRVHFVRLASVAMKQILIDHARAKNCLKRKAPGRQIEMDNVLIKFEDECGDIEALNQALEKLKVFDPKAAEIVELRFFLKLSVKQIAELLGASTKNIDRDWQAARAWLRGELLHDT